MIRHLGLRYHVSQGMDFEAGEEWVEEFDCLASCERKSIEAILGETVPGYSS
ncbi:MAG: hypothetical protein H8E96_03040 [Verrucomicrobiaceae bacterium]|nr:hypothetical protein [Verrucomicrobiaceae bacterium]